MHNAICIVLDLRPRYWYVWIVLYWPIYICCFYLCAVFFMTSFMSNCYGTDCGPMKWDMCMYVCMFYTLKKGTHQSYNFGTYPNYSTMATCQLKTKSLYLSAVLQFTAVVTDLCTRRDERISQNITMYSNLLAAMCHHIFGTYAV